MPLFVLLLIFYWLALATWFGGVMFVMIAAPIIFRTVRESDPTLPMVLSVNLEGEHSTLLAGSIMANLLTALTRIELICAAGVLVGLIGQWTLGEHEGLDSVPLIVRTVLYLGAVIVLLTRWKSLWPRMWEARQQYIDHADEPEKAEPARRLFNRHQRDSEMALMIVLALLLALVLFSGNIRPGRAHVTPHEIVK